MNEIKQPINRHKAYHAHVYFDSTTKTFARNLCSQVADLFNLQIGRFHERLIGPHPRWSCQIAFGEKQFDEFIPWLDKNRKDLTIFVHGLTGNDLKDHTEYAYWLGQSVELNLDIFD